MSNPPPIIILAGGLGTRLGDMALTRPKCLVPVNGKPFIDRQLGLLAKHGIKKVFLCLGHLSNQIAEYVGNGSRFGLEVKYSYDGEKLLGTGGSVSKATSLLEPDCQTFGVMYGDSYLDISFQSVFEYFKEAKKFGLICVSLAQQNNVAGNIEVKKNEVTKYDKTSPCGTFSYVDFGFLVFQRKVFEAFSAQSSFDLTLPLQDLIKQNQLAAFIVPDCFYEVGSYDGIKKLEEHLSDSA